MNEDNWGFDQGKNIAAITTVNVIEKKYSINIVIHYKDDHSWAFLCGTTNNTEDGRVISMEEAVKLDNSIMDICKLKPGWKAERIDKNHKWKIIKNE